MYVNGVLKHQLTNYNVRHFATHTIWNQTRNKSFFQNFLTSFNKVLKKAPAKDEVCEEARECCSPQDELDKFDSELKCTPEPFYSPTTQTKCEANVVIVGAGMAGLSAAKHLQDSGICNVTVLEALNRPGGRIQSAWLGDSVIELGCPNVHTPVTNPIVDRVFEDGLYDPPLFQADPSRGLLVRTDGSSIPYPISFEVYDKFKNILKEANDIDQSANMKFIFSRIEQEISFFPPKFENDALRLFLGLASMTTINSMHDISLIDTNEFGAFVKLPGTKSCAPLGLYGEIHDLYKDLPESCLRLGSLVVEIRWGGVHQSPRAIVKCAGGETYEADYVIITLPVGVLKTLSDSLFVPRLPVNKMNAIMKIGSKQKHLNKVFLKFEKPFWMWYKNIKKISFDANSNRKEGWLKGLTTLEPVRGSSHVMCLTVAGLEAQCLDCTSDSQIISDVVSLLQELTKRKVAEPMCVKRTNWSNDCHFLGACTYRDRELTSEHFYDLASPLPDDDLNPVLLFAGEASSPVHFGTVQGAKASGIREADRLLQLIRLNEAYETVEDNRMIQYCS